MKKTKIWVVCLSLLLCILLTVPVFASNDNKSTGEADGINTSMYDVSTALTAYVNNIVSPNRNEKHQTGTVTELNQFSSAQVGIAGAFVGYGDLKKDFKAFVTSSTSGSSSTSSYSSWLKLDNKNSIYGYCRYGYLLNDLGLDATASSATGVNNRSIIGFLLYIFYGCASMVPKVFEMVFDILQFLNPFQFLTKTGTSHIKISDLGITQSNAAKNITSFISDIYYEMQNMSWTAIIPIFYAVLAFNVFVLKDRGKSIPAMIKRIVFIGAGVAILSGVYTSTLNSMKDVVAGDAIPASRVVAGTLIDFESWVTSSRLSPVQDLKSVGKGSSSVTTDAGGADGDTYRQLRSITYKTNKSSGNYKLHYSDFTAKKDDVNGGLYDATSSKQSLKSETNDDKDVSTQQQLLELIGKYEKNEFYDAASWQSAVNNVINQNYRDNMGSSSGTAGADSNDNTVYNMYATTDEVKDWMNRDDSDNQAIFAGASLADGINWTTKSFNIFKNGNIQTDGTISPENDVIYKKNVNNWGNAADPSKNVGLSSISMYNYLTSSFSASSVMNYSAQQTSSEYSKQSHYSANIVGNTSLSYVFAINTLVLLGALVIIAFGYGFNLLIANVRRGFTFLTTVPFAMVGVLRQIVQAIVLVLIMIAEMIGTVALYMIMGDLLTLVASIVETSIREYTGTVLIGGVFGQIGLTVDSTVLGNSQFGIVLAVFVEILFVIGLTFTFMKLSPYYVYVHNKIWNRIYDFANITGYERVCDVTKPVVVFYQEVNG